MPLKKSNDVRKPILCPKCHAAMQSFKAGYRCVQAGCTFWVPREIRQKVLSDEIIAELVDKKETGIINGFQKRGNSQTFAARLYISTNWKIKIRPVGMTDFICPKCQGRIISFSQGYRCMDEYRCGYVLWGRFGGKQLSDDQLAMILTKGRCGPISGFISKKNGKKFSATIVMDAEGTLRFEFPA